MHNYRRIRDFHGTRARGVGSSDIPTLALLNLRYDQTPYKLWREKTGREAPWQGNEKTWWGHQLEGLVLRQWVSNPDRYGSDVANRFYREYLRRRNTGDLKVYTECIHPDYPFALAHADLLVEGDEPCIIEAKSHGYHAARRTEDPDFGYSTDDLSQNGIPASVFLQIQWQLFAYGLDKADLAVLINTNDYREYGPIVADPRTQEKCLALSQRFMWHVEHDKPPKPENWADIQLMYPHPQQTTAMVSGDNELEVRKMIERKAQLDERKKKIFAELDDLKNAIGLLIGENSVLASAEGNIFARSWETARWNLREAKKLEQTEPELFKRLVDEEYFTRSEARTLKF